MTEYAVRVTTKLIHWALTQSSTQCAIAQALRDANDEWERPWVNQKSIGFTDRDTHVRYSFATPAPIAEWISKFDADPSSVKPLTFKLDVVKEVIPETPYKRPRFEGASTLIVKGADPTPAIVTPSQRSTVQQRIDAHDRYKSGALVSRGAMGHRALMT